jgi:hypothetical protein
MSEVNTKRWSDWLEIVAAFGVILSLLFVGCVRASSSRALSR